MRRPDAQYISAFIVDVEIVVAHLDVQFCIIKDVLDDIAEVPAGQLGKESL